MLLIALGHEEGLGLQWRDATLHVHSARETREGFLGQAALEQSLDVQGRMWGQMFKQKELHSKGQGVGGRPSWGGLVYISERSVVVAWIGGWRRIKVVRPLRGLLK